MSLQELIIHYGYAVLFIGTFLEGETILIAAGFLASLGYLNLPWVVIAAFLGSFSGDQTFFYLGRTKGIQFLEKRGGWRRKVEKTFALLHRHQIPLVLGFRFLYGIRNVTPFVIGAAGLCPFRFFILNFLGALIWAIAFGYAGYEFGDVAELTFHGTKEYELIIFGVLVAAVCILFWRSNLTKSDVRHSQELGKVRDADPNTPLFVRETHRSYMKFLAHWHARPKNE